MTTANDIKNNPIKYGKLVLIVVAVIIVIVIAINIAGGVGNLLNGIKKFLHINTDPEADAARAKVNSSDQSSSNPSSPWSTSVYENAPGNAVFLDSQALLNAAEAIYDSGGFFIITPSEAYAAIKTMPSQADVSHLVAIFNDQYNRDLYTYMTRFFTSDFGVKTMAQILDYVKNLPVYKTY